jgi:hypothetical protein
MWAIVVAVSFRYFRCQPHTLLVGPSLNCPAANLLNLQVVAKLVKRMFKRRNGRGLLAASTNTQAQTAFQ